MGNVSGLQLVNEQGWRIGFTNLLRREISRRWSARNCLIQGAIWLVLLNLALAMVLEGQGTTASVTAGVNTFIAMAGILAPLGVVIAAQGAIVNERKAGTAAWVLSKPASRTAFILSKLVTIAVGFLALVIVLQGLIAYSQLSLAQGSLLPALGFLGGMSLLALSVLFYLSLALMLGTFFQARTPVILIPVGLIIAQAFLLGLLHDVAEWLPYLFPGSLFEVARTMVLGPPSSHWLLPIITSTLLSALFIFVAIRQFQREEL